jgi:hypothetical protein
VHQPMSAMGQKQTSSVLGRANVIVIAPAFLRLNAFQMISLNFVVPSHHVQLRCTFVVAHLPCHFAA